MLEISSEQLEALDAQRGELFVSRAEAHLRECFSEECMRLDAQGPEALADVVRAGVDKARSFDLSEERAISKFLNLMFTFGRDFDRDPACAWAQPILARSTVDLDHPMIDRLYEEALKHEAEAQGLGEGIPEEEEE